MIDRLPDGLERLAELSYNLWWTWHPEAVDLFRRISPELWEETDQNPVRLLVTVSPTRLRELAHDSSFLRSLERVCQAFDTYMEKPGWFERDHGESWGSVAYFSAEYGLAACLPIYAGGLGVLAGDHLKSASDLGVPLIGVGLLYRHRFKQCLTSNGHQSEMYSDSDVNCMPVQLCTAEDGHPVTVEVPCSNHAVRAQLWRAQVGRVPLFLLDADVPANSEHDRRISNRLYTSNPAKRIRQEIALGIGGMRALESLGLQPTVVHMNEGHSAFAALERIRILMSRQGLSFESAREIVSSTNVFTTHTSVGAAIDRFAPSLIDECLQAYPSLLGLTRQDFLALGRHQPWDDDEPFCMPVLALRLSAHANGVSKLHGETSRKLWSCVWSSQPDGRQPITSVTNGVHLRSWMCGSPIASLLDQYLGDEWHEDAAPALFWQKVDEIPDSEIWQAHQQARWRLIQETRRRLSVQLAEQGAPYREIARANSLLDPSALTIAFSRRFTAYKRPTLIFRDPRRLIRILSNGNRRVQVIFAGKAHPKDESGKYLIGQIAGFVRQTGLNDRITFIGDYDMNISRYLVQGADIWLNTPRRLLEACGTSGMKAAANGVLNMSTLDGWWPEAYEPDIGWAFGDGEPHENHDDEDAARLYDLLENEAIPLFYDRDGEGLPREWIRRMKASIKAICPSFNSNRMLREYCDRNYAPSGKLFARLCPGGVAASVPLPDKDTRYSGQETLPGLAHQPTWASEPFESSTS